VGDSGYPSYARQNFTPIVFFADWQPYPGLGWGGAPGVPAAGVPWASPSYWIDGFGIAHLSGLAYKPGGPSASPQDIGLGPGPAADATQLFPVMANEQLWRLDVIPSAGNGLLRVSVPGGANLPAGTYVSLSGLSYPCNAF
jgi:hypothetical protein